MNCPYCGKEMKKGYLQASGWILFGEEKHTLSFRPGKEDTVIAKDTGMGAYHIF